jgi:hypothetical protein
VKQPVIARMEHPDQNITLETIEKVSAALGIAFELTPTPRAATVPRLDWKSLKEKLPQRFSMEDLMKVGKQYSRVKLTATIGQLSQRGLIKPAGRGRYEKMDA